MRQVTTRTVAVAATGLLALSTGGAMTASADPGNGLAKGVGHHKAATTQAEQDRAKDYWTADRMKAAKPMGPETKAGNESQAVQVPAQSEFGKVFFTLQGNNYSCSATATDSTNGDVVTTAGHCVASGSTYASNWVFVPAYDNGAAPHGKWAATDLFAPTAWEQQDYRHDYAFAVMEEKGGQSINDVAGGYPIGFNLGYNLAFDAYGYPADKKYKGQKLFRCSATSTVDVRDTGIHVLPCDMTGGSSGGGWLHNGVLNSVNSHGYRGETGSMYGPYFGDTAQQVFTTAANS